MYDVAVIGGGIHGAGVAQAAAAAGFKTVLLEAGDWAGATSSRSSKLIHGGLRYLESADFKLVYHSLAERRRLLRLAPELVRPLRFHIPIYRHSRRRPWELTLGLGAYALLAGLGPLARFQRQGRRHWRQWPGLRRDGLQTVFHYWDAQTDDRALTRAVLGSARELGAELFEHTPVTAIDRAPGTGWCLHTEHGAIPARTVVNAAGPWVNTVAALAGPAVSQRPIALVRGSHLLLTDPPPAPGAWYLEATDGRAVFALPWYGGTLVGTTEVEVSAPETQPAPSTAEIDYLLQTLSRYFPDWRPRLSGSFAGLRVLPGGDGTVFRRSRETVLHGNRQSEPDWLSIYGGKLTTYRHTAERALAKLRPRLGPAPRNLDTAQLPLHPWPADPSPR